MLQVILPWAEPEASGLSYTAQTYIGLQINEIAHQLLDTQASFLETVAMLRWCCSAPGAKQSKNQATKSNMLSISTNSRAVSALQRIQ
jgi:hypothetical protein